MKSKLSRIAAFVMCLLLTLSVAAFALAETTGDAAAAAGAANPEPRRRPAVHLCAHGADRGGFLAVPDPSPAQKG